MPGCTRATAAYAYDQAGEDVSRALPLADDLCFLTNHAQIPFERASAALADNDVDTRDAIINVMDRQAIRYLEAEHERLDAAIHDLDRRPPPPIVSQNAGHEASLAAFLTNRAREAAEAAAVASGWVGGGVDEPAVDPPAAQARGVRVRLRFCG